MLALFATDASAQSQPRLTFARFRRASLMRRISRNSHLQLDHAMEFDVDNEVAFEQLLPRRAAAEFLTDLGLTIAPQTLARLYSEGKGPVCMHLGRRAIYKRADLLCYFRQQASAPNRSARDPRLPASDDDLPEAGNDVTAKLGLRAGAVEP
jgi:hypothetical protein